MKWLTIKEVQRRRYPSGEKALKDSLLHWEQLTEASWEELEKVLGIGEHSNRTVSTDFENCACCRRTDGYCDVHCPLYSRWGCCKGLYDKAVELLVTFGDCCVENNKLGQTKDFKKWQKAAGKVRDFIGKVYDREKAKNISAAKN